MVRAVFFTILLWMPMGLAAAEDLRISQLQQDVRDLQRQVQALARQIESSRVEPAGSPAAGVVRQRAVAPTDTPLWVDAAKWQRVLPGMSELEVIGILGAPTSMRAEGTDRVLLYALEIGSSGFLSGSIRLRDRSVVAISRPVLQ